MKNKTLYILAAAVVLVLAIAYGAKMYVSRSGYDGQAQDQTGVTKTFNIVAKQWDFEPAEIIVNRGDQVKLIISSLDVPHGLAIKEYGIDQKLEAGQTAEVSFLADKPGNFVFYCNVFCGEGHAAMKGVLVVK